MAKLSEDLEAITSRYNLPEAVLASCRAKAITSPASIAQTFEDETQFTNFVLDDSVIGKPLRLKLAMQMVYFDSLEHARKAGQPVKPTDSPDSVSEASELDGHEEERAEEVSSVSSAEVEEADDIGVAGGDTGNRPAWR
eukprot:CAMPEP_0172680542 /NCGR_PEP_ID=MMETSP1074-20121228/16836_1 /TAXON_ID=2916 /ORGANISM="Ceratium fusus, Strain PA161109" /LENGTH=138 /DNA_ID=CAMNT_0013498885 /DNA_START=85 /DNA_END=497 /DNA_ORIENTATION=-